MKDHTFDPATLTGACGDSDAIINHKLANPRHAAYKPAVTFTGVALGVVILAAAIVNVAANNNHPQP